MKINQGYDYDGAPKRPARDPGSAGAEPKAGGTDDANTTYRFVRNKQSTCESQFGSYTMIQTGPMALSGHD